MDSPSEARLSLVEERGCAFEHVHRDQHGLVITFQIELVGKGAAQFRGA